MEDYGKVAVTFVDTQTAQAVRIAPRRDVRTRAPAFAPEARNKWKAQLLGYQRMSDADLLDVQAVRLTTSIEWIVSRAGRKAICDACGEEIINQREVVRDGVTLCHSCAGPSYYAIIAAFAHVWMP